MPAYWTSLKSNRIQKLIRNIVQAKESLIKDLKEKFKLLEAQKNKITNETCNQSLLQDNIKMCKKELNRKQSLVKHWKEKANQTERELQKLKEASCDMVDPKVWNSLQSTLRASREKSAKVNQELERLKQRDQQYENVLEQFILAGRVQIPDLSTLPLNNGGLDPSKITAMAEKLSSEVFWS